MSRNDSIVTGTISRTFRSYGGLWTEVRAPLSYNQIRKMEQGEQAKSRWKLPAAQIKILKSVLSEENLDALKAMGEDLGALLNAAVERFIFEPREMERLWRRINDPPRHS